MYINYYLYVSFYANEKKHLFFLCFEHVILRSRNISNTNKEGDKMIELLAMLSTRIFTNG